MELWKRIGPLFRAPAEYRVDARQSSPVFRFDDGRRVKSAPDWRSRRAELLRFWHGLLGVWPPLLTNPKIVYLEQEHLEGFTRRKVQLEIAPGRETTAYLLVPDGGGRRGAALDVFYYPEDGAGLNRERRQQNDFGYQLARRGIVSLCIGQQPGLEGSPIYFPSFQRAQLQPLSYLAYVAANCCNLLAKLPGVDSKRIGVVGHSYGGKWALFAGALYDRFACVAVSDPGIVFDETRPNVNYWEPWYLGYEAGAPPRARGIPNETNPRTGPYRTLVEAGRDLDLLHALLAPRPFLVAGGSEDPPARWKSLAPLIGVNSLLGYEERVGMANRAGHDITPQASSQICDTLEYFLSRSP
jgi:pimeloyl-ACP methyl ester carboxylesterase